MNDKVALLTNIPAPYRLPFFRELSSYCNLLVIFDDYTEPNRKWMISKQELEFPHTIAKGFCIHYQRKHPDINIEEERYLQIRYGILPALAKFKPSVIISAEMGLRTLQAAMYSKVTGTPFILWWEGTRHTEGWVGQRKSYTRKLIVKEAQRFWSNGHESTKLLMDYGASPNVVDEGMTGVDTNFFAIETRKLVLQRQFMRSHLGLKGVVLLFIGQFIHRKGLHNYLEALKAVHESGLKEWSAVFVGSGSMESFLHNWRAQHPDVPVIISNFVQPHELPKFYAIADVFVMPTLEDVWGLVSLEAVVAGVPQIFSVYGGCTPDLLRDKRMGCAINPLNAEEFASALKDYIKAPPPRLPEKLSQQFVEYYSPTQLAARAWKSIQKLLN